MHRGCALGSGLSHHKSGEVIETVLPHKVTVTARLHNSSHVNRRRELNAWPGILLERRSPAHRSCESQIARADHVNAEMLCIIWLTDCTGLRRWSEQDFVAGTVSTGPHACMAVHPAAWHCIKTESKRRITVSVISCHATLDRGPTLL